MHSREMQHKVFLLILTVVTVAFGWILLPFYGAVFWGVVLAILFAPLYQRMLRSFGQRRNLASILTLLLALLVVILPMILLSISLLQEAVSVFERIRSNQIDFGTYFRQAIAALPDWLVGLLDRFGLAQLATLQDKLAASAAQGSQIVAKQAVNVGQNMLDFLIGFGIMLYLLFFLLRDGTMLAARVRQAIPLSAAHKQQLFSRFATVIRATVKGNIVVALVQGALGGMMFWFLGVQAALLWGALMAFLSLLPAVGAGLVWGPVAIYFLLTGAVWQGVTLILFGVFVIGLVDNVLRPILVGKDTRMPDYLVLISTVGGIALLGLNGFVIGPVIAALFIAAWDLFAQEPDVRSPDDGE
ncbi:MAG TPA: AI-2E family transporter [Noviherbaspirillum sp.]|nr:AI-2E family transporter [Noviherbaspirillum sp.]